MSTRKDGTTRYRKRTRVTMRHTEHPKGRGVMHLTIADALASFEINGTTGRVYWPVGGTSVVVEFASDDVTSDHYSFPLDELVRVAFRWRQQRRERRARKAAA